MVGFAHSFPVDWMVDNKDNEADGLFHGSMRVHVVSLAFLDVLILRILISKGLGTFEMTGQCPAKYWVGGDHLFVQPWLDLTLESEWAWHDCVLMQTAPFCASSPVSLFSLFTYYLLK